jgi:hypothetical protein
MGNSNKVKPISDNKRKQLTDNYLSDEKLENSKILSNWIINTNYKKFVIIFKLSNGKDIYLLKYDNEFTLFSDNDRTFDIKEINEYIYKYCLNKTIRISCYKDKKFKEKIWEIKYDKNMLITIPL